MEPRRQPVSQLNVPVKFHWLKFLLELLYTQNVYNNKNHLKMSLRVFFFCLFFYFIFIHQLVDCDFCCYSEFMRNYLGVVFPYDTVPLRTRCWKKPRIWFYPVSRLARNVSVLCSLVNCFVFLLTWQTFCRETQTQSDPLKWIWTDFASAYGSILTR